MVKRMVWLNVSYIHPEGIILDIWSLSLSQLVQVI